MGRHCDKPIDLSVVFVFAWTGWEALVRRIAEVAVGNVPALAFLWEKLDAVDSRTALVGSCISTPQSRQYSLASSDGRRPETRYVGPNVLSEE